MWSFVKKHWRVAASFACGAGAIVLAPISLPAAGVAALICSAAGLSAGKAYEAGKAVGGFINEQRKK